MKSAGSLRRNLLWTSASVSVLSCLIVPLVGGAASAAGGLPSGGHYVAGKGAIGGSSASITVNQSSTTGIIDWNSFSIGKNKSVTFDNGSGATLNEVTGGNLSTIAGSLHASGSIYLIDQSGVIVSGSGRVVTGGSFVASTQDSDGRQRGNILDAGTIRSGAVRLSGLNVSVPGSIAVTRGGHIWLTSSGSTSISGALDAQSANGAGGDVTVRGNDITVSGRVDASATSAAEAGGTVSIVAKDRSAVTGEIEALGGSQGRGGSIETSGHDLSFGGARIDAGPGGHWLLDPYDLTVDSSAASTIDTSLGGDTNVTLQTTANSASGPGITNPNGNGDIFVNSALNWGTAATLTLSAYRNVSINAPITVSGAGGVSILTNTGGNGGTYSFGLVPTGFHGRLNFTGGSSSGASLSINFFQYTLVYNMSELQNINAGNSALDGGYALATSVDAVSTSNWTPLGTNGAGSIDNSGSGFAGVFEGLGNTISNLNVNLSSENYIGLFGYSSGTIRDLRMAGGSIRGQYYVGALVGTNTGTIDSVFETGTVTGIQQVGGLVGNDTGAISASYATGAVSASSGLGGGLVGYNNNGNLVGDYATGAVGGSSSDLGGLVGESSGGSISQSFATGSVNASDASNYYDGGLVGVNATTITNSYATGAVYGEYYVGGLVGSNSAAISSSYATGPVSGSGTVGGLIGYSYGVSLSQDYATGAVSGTNGTIGGLVGNMYDGAVTQSYASGAVSGGTSSTVGGLVGDAYSDASIDQSYATGAVSGGSYVGGLVGSLSNNATVTESYSTGSVSSTNSPVGGLIGYNSGSTVTNSYWDTQTAGQAASAGGTGLTTTQLQDVLPSGFNSGVWGTSEGLFPYFLWQYSSGAPQVVSGFAYKPGGIHPLASTTAGAANVSLLVNGTSEGEVTTGANGYYYFVLAPGTISASGSAVLAYTTQNFSTGEVNGATLQEATGRLSFDNVWGATFIAPTADTTYSTATATSLQTQDSGLITQAVGSNAAAQSLVAGLSNYGFFATGSDFVINESLSLSQGLYVQTTQSNAGIVIEDAVNASGAAVDLLSHGTLSEGGSGVITAEALLGASYGAATLNASNAITLLGFTTTQNGNFSLVNDGLLEMTIALNAGSGNVTLQTTGSNNEIALEAALTGASVDLVSSGAIASNSAGVITANTLTGSSAGKTSLTAQNQVNELDAFTTSAGTFSLTNDGPLTVVQAINAGADGLTLNVTNGNLAIDAALDGGTVTLASAGGITQDGSGIITASALTGSSVGAVSLTDGNHIAALGTFSTGSNNLSLNDAESLTVNGAVDVGGGTLVLRTSGAGSNLALEAPLTGYEIELLSAGAISQSAGAPITSRILIGDSDGTVALTADNAVELLGTFSTDDHNFAITNAQQLQVTQAVNAEDAAITLTTVGTGVNIALQGKLTAGEVDLVSAGAIVSNSGGIIDASELTGSSAGKVALTAANAVSDLGAFSTDNGAFSLTDAHALVVDGTVDAGTGTLALTTGSNDTLAIEAAITGKTVDLTSGGKVEESSAGAVTANLLNVVANTGITLTSTKNDITTIGTDTTNSGPNEIVKN